MSKEPSRKAPRGADVDEQELLDYTKAMLVSLQKLTNRHHILNHLLNLAAAETDFLIQDQQK